METITQDNHLYYILTCIFIRCYVTRNKKSILFTPQKYLRSSAKGVFLNSNEFIAPLDYSLIIWVHDNCSDTHALLLPG